MEIIRYVLTRFDIGDRLPLLHSGILGTNEMTLIPTTLCDATQVTFDHASWPTSGIVRSGITRKWVNLTIACPGLVSLE